MHLQRVTAQDTFFESGRKTDNVVQFMILKLLNCKVNEHMSISFQT